MRLTLADIQTSRLPAVMGYMPGDLPRIAAIVNEAQERLIMAAGATGWTAGWVKVVFSVTAASPYITLPAKFSRIINMDVCKVPIRVYNEFFEVLPEGPGLQQATNTVDWCGKIAGYERGTYPTLVDLTVTNQLLRVYYTDIRDIGKRILIQGLDQNGNEIYSQDGANKVVGTFLDFAAPFSTTAFIITSIESIQKDITYGDIILRQVDATTGVEVTLSRYGAYETNPAYRRYYITKLPSGCCPTTSTGSVQVTAMCKLEYFPASNPTDQLIIQNKPALIEEAQAIRYSEMDDTDSQTLSAIHHKAAVRQLQNQMRHYHGEQTPSVTVDQFMGADLEEHGIGTLI